MAFVNMNFVGGNLSEQHGCQILASALNVEDLELGKKLAHTHMSFNC